MTSFFRFPSRPIRWRCDSTCCPSSLTPFKQVQASGHRWDLPPKIRFAPDSPLEEDGFEPSVPLGREVMERSNISTRWVLFQGGLRVRIRLPPAANLVRTWLSGANPIDDPRGISPRQPQRGHRLRRAASSAETKRDSNPRSRPLLFLSEPVHPGAAYRRVGALPLPTWPETSIGVWPARFYHPSGRL